MTASRSDASQQETGPLAEIGTFETISYQVAANGVAVITIDVKDRPMNVLTPELHREIGRVADVLKRDETAVGAVIQSGKDSFLAGGDLKRIVGLYDLRRSPKEAYDQSRAFTESLRQLETCGKPVAVAINGVALGGGLELALACHYRVLLDEAKVSVGLPETTLGLLPGAGGTQRLPRLIGIKQAASMILAGKTVNPSEALDMGIVDALAPAEQLFATAERWVLEHGDPVQPWDKKGFKIPGGAGLTDRKIAALFQALTRQVTVDTRQNYPAPIAALRSIFQGTSVQSIDTALQTETREFSALTRDPVARNMIRTLFLNRGVADRLGKRPKNVDRTQVDCVTLSGSGTACAPFAYSCIRRGINVEIDAAGISDVHRYASQQLAAEKKTQEQIDSILSRIRAREGSSAAALLYVQQQGDADALCEHLTTLPASTVIALGNPRLTLDSLSAVSERAQPLAGFYLSAPADRSRVVEIVVDSNTEDTTLACLMDLSKALRKTPTVQKASSRCFSESCVLAYIEQGIRMLAEGVSPVLIENAAHGVGMPQGPLARADARSLHEIQRDIPEIADKLGGLLDEGRDGVPTRRGFYDYDADGAKTIWAGLQEHFSVNSRQPDVQTIKQCLLTVQALAAARYCEADLIDPVDADILSVLAWGFPSYTGGAISYIDTLGLSAFVEQCRTLSREFGDQFEPSAWLCELAATTDRVYPDAA